MYVHIGPVPKATQNTQMYVHIGPVPEATQKMQMYVHIGCKRNWLTGATHSFFDDALGSPVS